jgi:hypothetical protein
MSTPYGGQPPEPPAWSPSGWSDPTPPAPGWANGGWANPGWAGWQPPPPGPPPAPRPGIVPLRPLDLGEILDGALQAIRGNPRAMLGLPAIVAGCYLVLSTLVELVPGGLSRRAGLTDSLPADATGHDVLVRFGDLVGAAVGYLALVAVLGLLYALAQIAVQACLTWLVAQATLGRRHPVSDAWRAVRGRLIRLVGLAILQGLIVAGVSAVVAAVAFGGVALAVGTLHGLARVLVIAVVALVALLLWLFAVGLVVVRLLLAAPILVLGGTFAASGVRPGIGRALAGSWRLVRGSSWRVFGVAFVVYLVAQVVSGIVALPVIGVGVALGVAGSATGHPLAAAFGSSTAGGLGSLVGTMLALPFISGATTLLYLDLRMRREGLDLALGFR